MMCTVIPHLDPQPPSAVWIDTLVQLLTGAAWFSAEKWQAFAVAISVWKGLLRTRELSVSEFPQRNDFSLADVSVQQSLDFRSWPSCVMPFIHGEVVLSLQCTNLYGPGCIEQHKLHYSLCLGVLSLEWTSVWLSVLVGLKWNRIWCLLRILCNKGNDDVVTFSLISGSFSSFDKGPAWVATGFKCSLVGGLFTDLSM